MTIASDERAGGIAASIVAVAIAASGCASTSGAADESEGANHEIPVEVSDHTVDAGSESSGLERPRVDVTLETGGVASVDPVSYERPLEERAVRCYRRSLEEAEGGERPQGSLVYQLIVTRNGKVAGTELMSSLLRQPEIRRCVEYALARLEFGVARRGRPLYRMTVRLDFRIETLLPAEPPV
ncbi:MAG: hypothetical protein ABEL76_03120 [Bradymonadaceae bacterium]